MIAINDLSFAYPDSDFRLTIPSLVLEPGEKVAVVGPSGTGKTTLLNLIAGITVPQSGTVRLGDVTVSNMGDAARRSLRAARIGFVFQDFALLEYLTARENILFPYRIAAGAKIDDAARTRAVQLAQSCGLDGKLDRRPGALSQGEQQRVALCRSLIMKPDLVLADEATGNLDPANKVAILDLLFARTSEQGATLLAVTHDHELLPRFDRVIDFATFRDTGEHAA
ncbi:ABC transporter ATP-binding protein [Loktanella sp. 3ANDIMAR09]|uniref:ABC transporter ATP-binding protein n=1 Tax=Loktanella sp. 3ANDIMAR09 TaxID=1225657 RepID=UPI0007000E2F|nr:ABC transporter ATP-binding protein [Loktanella sp. 3ANDIMAR09]KQI67885.1 ABC transporter ATP-binding protein [Loktanella sp. 3ANDIMAR09]